MFRGQIHIHCCTLPWLCVLWLCVQDEGSFPLLVEEWGAIEEVLLLDAVEQDGFGNWEDIAAHVVTKTARGVCACVCVRTHLCMHASQSVYYTIPLHLHISKHMYVCHFPHRKQRSLQ